MKAKAHLPRRLKKATKKFMRYYHKSSMVIIPQAQFVYFNNKGLLIVCHAFYKGTVVAVCVHRNG